MPRGQVKWFDPKKGYGFIVGPEGQDVFVHYSHIQSDGFRTLKDGEAVDYELIQGEKGWQARSVSAVERASDDAAAVPMPSASAASAGYESADGSVEGAAAGSRGGYEGAGGYK